MATIKGERIYYVDALHRRFGPIVQISPEEIAISDVAAVKEIHRIGGGFLKSTWYQKFTQEDSSGDERELGLFTIRDAKIHSARRKLFAHGFSKNALSVWEPVIHERVTKAIDGMSKELAAQGKTDVLAWLTFMVRHARSSSSIQLILLHQANDVMSTLAFGHCLNNLELGQVSRERDIDACAMRLTDHPLYRKRSISRIWKRR